MQQHARKVTEQQAAPARAYGILHARLPGLTSPSVAEASDLQHPADGRSAQAFKRSCKHGALLASVKPLSCCKHQQHQILDEAVYS